MRRECPQMLAPCRSGAFPRKRLSKPTTIVDRRLTILPLHRRRALYPGRACRPWLHFQQTSNDPGFGCPQFGHGHSGNGLSVTDGSIWNAPTRWSLPCKYAYSRALGVTSRILSSGDGTLISTSEAVFHRRISTVNPRSPRFTTATSRRDNQPLTYPISSKANPPITTTQKIQKPERCRTAKTILQFGHRTPQSGGADFDQPENPIAASRSIRCRQFGQTRQLVNMVDNRSSSLL